jgi:hypothetical protein
MNFSGRLPMNPWLLIALIVSLLAVAAWSIGGDHMGWLAPADFSAMALQLAWILQAGLYAFDKADQKLGTSAERARQRRLMFGALICLAIAAPVLFIGFSFFANRETGTITGTAALPFGLAMLLGAASFFTFIFRVAKILCQAEEKETGERIFVTCLLLCYLIIGAPFVFNRLKRLEQPRGSGLQAA